MADNVQFFAVLWCSKHAIIFKQTPDPKPYNMALTLLTSLETVFELFGSN